MAQKNFIPCTIKMLPNEQWVVAADNAIRINPNNAPAVHQLKQVFPEAIPPVEHLALLTSKYWGNGGVNLTVGFLDNPPSDLRSRILSHMNAWGQFANVKFTETNQIAQVRISRSTPAPNNGYWSYLGTDILNPSIGLNNPTMNLEGFTMNTIDSEFYRVIRHETGHTLGFPHEHLRSEIIDGIDREKAITYFMQTQGWPRDKVIAQVLTPIDNSALIATAHADPNSIMCYWLPPQIMKNGVAIPGGTDIDAQDADFATLVYPKNEPYQRRTLETATTFGNENDGTWQLMPNLDLVFIKTTNTTNGHVEVHIASRTSNYQQRTLETTTTFGNENDGTWQLMPNLDLVFIKTSNTPNGHVEVHIASRTSNYQQRTLETATTFGNENDGTWQLMPNLDLVFIKTSNTPNGHVEVHIASRSSNYQQRTLESATTFGNENDGTWQLMSNLDLAFIKTSNTPNGHVEVHIASRSSNYQQRTLESATTFGNENDGTWQLMSNLDLVFIKTTNTPNGHVEVHIASRT